MEKTYTLYILENKKNGKRYVGQTTRPLDTRIYQHQNGDSVISKAIQKYGVDSFEITSFTAPSLEALNKIEVALIDGLDAMAHKHGYNILEGGSNWPRSANDKAHLKDSWTDEKRTKQSRKIKQAWVRRRGRCEVCGKDETMGYDPDIDFRLCPSCRHAHHLSQDLGITDVRKK